MIQAAELAIEKARAAVQRFDADVRGGAGRQVELAKRKSAEHLAAVKEVSVETLHRARALANDGVAAVRQGAVQVVASARTTSESQKDFVLERAGSHVLRVRVAIDGAFDSMREGALRVVQDAKSKSEALVREITGQGPAKTLGRGFAIVRDAGGMPVTRVGHVAPGQSVSVQFSDGAIGAKVEGTTK